MGILQHEQVEEQYQKVVLGVAITVLLLFVSVCQATFWTVVDVPKL
jgi:hypothetical protein